MADDDNISDTKPYARLPKDVIRKHHVKYKLGSSKILYIKCKYLSEFVFLEGKKVQSS